VITTWITLWWLSLLRVMLVLRCQYSF